MVHISYPKPSLIQISQEKSYVKKNEAESLLLIKLYEWIQEPSQAEELAYKN
jgi:hypothetical protein